MMRPEPQGDPLLRCEHLFVSFERTPVLQDVTFSLWSQQVVALVGPNGAGKTTILRAIGGIIRPVRGRIFFKDDHLESLPVWDVVQRGIVYVPEGMNVFPEMSVMENLEVGAYLNRGNIPERLKMVYCLFPELKEKRNVAARTLSGGQQRMVTLGRGLMAGARLLLLDDPFLGLSPKIVHRFCNVFRSLRRSGITLLIAGQHVRRILNVADLAFLVEDGSITLSGPGPKVLNDHHLQHILFGVTSRERPQP